MRPKDWTNSLSLWSIQMDALARSAALLQCILVRPHWINFMFSDRKKTKRYKGARRKKMHTRKAKRPPSLIPIGTREAYFTCVCFSSEDSKRNWGGDSNHTIYFGWPNDKGSYIGWYIAYDKPISASIGTILSICQPKGPQLFQELNSQNFRSDGWKLFTILYMVLYETSTSHDYSVTVKTTLFQISVKRTSQSRSLQHLAETLLLQRD